MAQTRSAEAEKVLSTSEPLENVTFWHVQKSSRWGYNAADQKAGGCSFGPSGQQLSPLQLHVGAQHCLCLGTQAVDRLADTPAVSTVRRLQILANPLAEVGNLGERVIV